MLVIFGVMVGYLSLSTAVDYQVIDQQDITAEDQSSDEKSPTQESIQSLNVAIPSSAQVNIHFEYLLIDILPGLEVENEEIDTSNEKTGTSQKILKILFQRIIAPNAP